MRKFIFIIILILDIVFLSVGYIKFSYSEQDYEKDTLGLYPYIHKVASDYSEEEKITLHSGKIFDNIPESPHTEKLKEFLLKEEKDLSNIDKKLVLNEKQYIYQKEKESYMKKLKFEGVLVCMILIACGILTCMAYEELT